MGIQGTLIEVFVRNPGRVLTRDRLIDAAWGRDMAITDRVVDTQVFNPRKKIEAIPAEPQFPVGGLGVYVLFVN